MISGHRGSKLMEAALLERRRFRAGAGDTGPVLLGVTMAHLVWKFTGGDDLACDAGSLRLVVDKSPIGNGYRFRVSCSRGARPGTLASGYREELREALDAAEKASRTLAA